MDSAGVDRLDRAAYLIAVLFTAAVFLFGWQYHPVPVGGAENDGYVAAADTIRAGALPVDPYRPLLYPLLAAGVGAVVGDTFTGAKLISNAAAGLLVLLTYLIGRSCFGREVGLFAMLCAVTNTALIQAGVLAATDILFSAVSALVLLLALRVTEKPDLVRAALLGGAFGLAFFTRYTAMALLPAIVLALALAPAPLLQRARAAGAFGVAAVLALVPHMVLTYAVFGAPFYTETWQNLAFKLYGAGDWTYFNRIPFDGLGSVIAHDPQLFVRSALEEAYKFATNQFPRLVGNADLLLTGTLFTALFVFGLYRLAFELDRKVAVLLTYFVVSVALVSVFYLVKVRLLLPILPAAYAVIGYCAVKVAFPWFMRLGRRQIQAYAPLLALLLVLQSGALLKQLEWFVAEHPWAELRAQETPDARLAAEAPAADSPPPESAAFH